MRALAVLAAAALLLLAGGVAAQDCQNDETCTSCEPAPDANRCDACALYFTPSNGYCLKTINACKSPIFADAPYCLTCDKFDFAACATCVTGWTPVDGTVSAAGRVLRRGARTPPACSSPAAWSCWGAAPPARLC